MPASDADKAIVRTLAKQLAEAAAHPSQDEKRKLWIRKNKLEKTRPLMVIFQIPWWEFVDEEELQCQCEDPLARGIENNLRISLYYAKNLATDMPLDGFFSVQYAYSDTGYGMQKDSVESEGGVAGMGARHYHNIMEDDEDIERIQLPIITPNWEATEQNYQAVCDVIGDTIPVVKQGVTHMWSAPWDILIEWWGIENLYMDMYDRPEFVHKGISRMMDALLARLDQLEEHKLLTLGNNCHPAGSGGFGITDLLPEARYDGTPATPMQHWGTSTGQIFSEVSADMHDEFCLQHELRWLERFGLNCYGCCEPLHDKIHILRQIPRLRRISMSPWIDVDKAAQNMGDEFIFSYKPNPSVLAWDKWDVDSARRELRAVLDKTRGCHMELVMKDVSTCRKDPQRLKEWCRMTMDLAQEYA